MAEFLQTLLEIEKRCSDTVRIMAQGVLELKDMHHIDKQTEASIQYFLDRFYMSRIRYIRDSVKKDKVYQLRISMLLQPENAYEPAYSVV